MTYCRTLRPLLAYVGLPAIIVVAACSTIHAAPSITNVSLRGLQIGGTTTITIDGGQLLPDSRIVFPFDVTAQKIMPNATNNRIQVAVTLDESVQPGIYSLRLANSNGISNAITVGIDALVQRLFAEQVDDLPIALHGTLAGGQILRTKLVGKKGQRIVVDAESQRLGAKLKPVLRLYDQRGTQISWSPPNYKIDGDARIDTVLPSDGEYTVELHDVLYRGASPGFYRIKIGDLHYADIVFPIGVTAGENTSLQLLSTNVTSEKAIQFKAAAIRNTFFQALPMHSVAHFTGHRPRVVVSDHTEFIESSTSDGSLQNIQPVPVAMNGRISATGEEDKYLLPVQPGSKIRFDVLARRIGSPLDGVLIIRNDKGNELARNDDRPGMSDPGLDFAVPAGVKQVVVAIHDLQRRGGDDFVYRIAVRDLSQPEFSLTLDTDRINIPAGGSQVIKIQAKRSTYKGPIRLSVDGIPNGVQVAGDTIDANSTIGLLTLTAPADASASGLATIVGRSVDSKNMATVVSQLADAGTASRTYWRPSEIGLAVTKPGAVSIAWGDFGDDSKLLTGSSRTLPIQLTRRTGAKGIVRVRLMTTQVPPTKKVKQGRTEKVVKDDARTLRADNAEFAPDAKDSAINIITPVDLPQQQWGLVVIAELLSPDKKRVIASSSTPATTLTAVQAFRLQLTGPNKIEAKAGDGETGKFAGKLIRNAAFKHPVKITLAGLPKGYPAPTIDVPADQAEFELPVRFPANAKPMELMNIKLRATSQTDAKDPKSLVTAPDINVNLKVVAGKKTSG